MGGEHHVCDPSNPDCAAYLHYKDPANRQPAEDAQIHGPRHRPKRLTRHVPIRFAAETIDQAMEIAAQEGLTVSSWIRRTVERELAKHPGDLGTRNAAAHAVRVTLEQVG